MLNTEEGMRTTYDTRGPLHGCVGKFVDDIDLEVVALEDVGKKDHEYRVRSKVWRLTLTPRMTGPGNERVLDEAPARTPLETV